MARSRRHGLSSRDRGPVLCLGCAARGALRATSGRDLPERWTIGSNDVPPLYRTACSHGRRPRLQASNLDQAGAGMLQRCVVTLSLALSLALSVAASPVDQDRALVGAWKAVTYEIKGVRHPMQGLFIFTKTYYSAN